MTREAFGTITALQYATRPRLGFPEIVAQFDKSLQKHPTQTRSLSWDCDDIAIIDRGPLRVALGWLAPEVASNAETGADSLPGDAAQQPWYLVIAAGAQPGQRSRRFDAVAYEMISRRIAERVQGYLPFDAVIRGPANRPITADLLDATFELLRAEIRDDRARQPDPPEAAPGDAAPPEAVAEHCDTDAADGTAAKTARLTAGTIEDAHVLPDAPSVPLRLTIFTFSLTLMMHVPALGAMLLVYATLREIYPVVT